MLDFDYNSCTLEIKIVLSDIFNEIKLLITAVKGTNFFKDYCLDTIFEYAIMLNVPSRF